MDHLVGVRRLPGRRTKLAVSVITRAELLAGCTDALIAATALVHSLTLDTRNIRDFTRVPGLRLRKTR